MSRPKKQDELFDHDYDGIQEYDNDLPPWWVGLFFATMIFAFLYLMWFHVLGIGDSSAVKYKKSVDSTYVRLPQDQGSSLMALIFNPQHSVWYNQNRPEITQANLLAGKSLLPHTETVPVDTTVAVRASAADIAAGNLIFHQYCFTCHGMNGEGGIGPNLTDDYWIHGGRFADVVHTIRKGYPINGMIAWEKSLNPDQIMQVASYVQLKLRGSSPLNPKSPQGDPYAAAE